MASQQTDGSVRLAFINETLAHLLSAYAEASVHRSLFFGLYTAKPCVSFFYLYKNACIGMQLSDIKEYINMAMLGDETIDERLQMFLHRKEETEQQIKELEKTLETINYKIWFYETAKEKGTTEGIACKCMDVPEKFRAVKRRISNFS